jgi:hypothetical protein
VRTDRNEQADNQCFDRDDSPESREAYNRFLAEHWTTTTTGWNYGRNWRQSTVKL